MEALQPPHPPGSDAFANTGLSACRALSPRTPSRQARQAPIKHHLRSHLQWRPGPAQEREPRSRHGRRPRRTRAEGASLIRQLSRSRGALGSSAGHRPSSRPADSRPFRVGVGTARSRGSALRLRGPDPRLTGVRRGSKQQQGRRARGGEQSAGRSGSRRGRSGRAGSRAGGRACRTGRTLAATRGSGSRRACGTAS